MRRCSLLFGCPAPSGSASCAQRAVRESPAIQSTGAAAVESFLEVEKACPKPRASVSTSSGRSSARESARIVCCVETIRADSLALDLPRSEEHTSELQSRLHLVCRLL